MQVFAAICILHGRPEWPGHVLVQLTTHVSSCGSHKLHEVQRQLFFGPITIHVDVQRPEPRRRAFDWASTARSRMCSPSC